MNILITGCNGQLGSELRLQEASYPQHNFFNTDIGDLDICDLAGLQSLFADESPDVVLQGRTIPGIAHAVELVRR